jgi:uncharacterized protein (DUF58 family)
VHTLQEISEQHRFGRLELLATQVVEGFITGLHRSPYHGFSVEFVEHRMYNAGESKKHVDWKLYAKTDKLYVKKYEDETNLRCQIVIDTSSSMYFPEKSFNKLQFSIFSAAAIMQLMKKQRDAVGLSLFSDQMDWQAKGKLTQAHQKRMFLELEQLLENEIKRNVVSSQTASILHDLAERLNQRTLIVLFSDMFSQDNEEDLFSALQHLRFKKHELIIFHVSDPQTEQHLDFSNRPHRFVDIETGQEVKLNPAHIQEEFQAKMSSFYQTLKLKCTQFKIDFVEADIRQPFGEILNAFLIKRQRLY